MPTPTHFKSSGGFDAGNRRITNLEDAQSSTDALNLRTFDTKNTVQSFDTGRSYVLGFVVEYSGHLWKCVSAASAGAFDKTKWKVINGPENWVRITAAYTAVNGDALYIDTTSGAITVTLPIAPKSGDYINVIDAGSANINNITINRNGSTIAGSATNLVINDPNVQLLLVYLNGTWVLNIDRVNRIKSISSATTAEANITYAIEVSTSFTVTLPASPKPGDWVVLQDRNGGIGANIITVSGNSKQIDGSASYLMNQKRAGIQFIYNGTQWVTFAISGNSLQADKNLSDLENKAAARTSLELNTMAQKVAGTGATEYRDNTQNDAVYQPKDATLTALAALVTAANKLTYSTGVDTYSQTDLTTLARTFLAASSTSAQQAALSLSDAAYKGIGESIGQLMEVGAFGLGSGATYADNLDTLTKTGFYTSVPGTVGSPSASYRSAVMHFEHNTSYVGGMQIAVLLIGTLYIRNRDSGGTWSAWIEIATVGSFGTAATKDFGTSTGQLMEVGAFGLGGSVLPTTIAGQDLNTLTTGGYWNITGPINAPLGSSNTHHVLVLADNTAGGRHVQIAQVATLSGWYIRSQSAGVWSDWISIITSLDIGTAAAKDFGTSTGQLMEVGAFGLGTNGNHGNTSADVNTLTQAGWYWVNAAGANKPVAGSGCLFVNAAPNLTTVSQWFYEAVSTASTTIWFRTKNFSDSSWKPWVQLYHNGNLFPAWTNITLQNTWANYDTGLYDAMGYRLEGKRVYLRGVIAKSTIGVADIATIPVGYRPIKQKLLANITLSAGVLTRLRIYPTGVITLDDYTTADDVITFDNVSFEID